MNHSNHINQSSDIFVNGGTPQVWSIFRDHLGSITHVKNGTTVQEYSYDAWGRRRDKDDWSYTLTSEPALFADRGFTGHEHLTEFGLINMNGRLYDPLVGRFLSPDNYVQDASSTQNFNRYGYCLNNPLRYTDPDGEFWHIIIGGVVGGVINLATNWNNCDGFWEYAAAFGVGAGAGALTAATGGAAAGTFMASTGAALGAAAIGGASTTATNNIISQTGKNFSGSVDWGQVGFSSLVGGVSGIAGYGAAQWATNNLGNALIGSMSINSPVVSQGINGFVGGAAGGYAGGFTSGLLFSGGDLKVAAQSGWSGLKAGAAIGGGLGAATGYVSAKANGVNPWTGERTFTYKSVGAKGKTVNVKKLNDSYLKKNGLDAHDIKYEYLGRGAKVSNFDLYKAPSGQLIIYQKNGIGVPIPTDYIIP